MSASRTPDAIAPDLAVARAWFGERRLEPRTWSNEPGFVYGEHDHDYHKILFCLAGDIVFHTDDGDLHLRPGDRLDVEPGTRHAATVGANGVTCIEADD
ncbi:MAG: cupin domain-containing protein [Nitriliruptorales bacterium]